VSVNRAVPVAGLDLVIDRAGVGLGLPVAGVDEVGARDPAEHVVLAGVVVGRIPVAPQDVLLLFFFIILPPPRSTLFPYTTLFRSAIDGGLGHRIVARPFVARAFVGDERIVGGLPFQQRARVALGVVVEGIFPRRAIGEWWSRQIGRAHV